MNYHYTALGRKLSQISWVLMIAGLIFTVILGSANAGGVHIKDQSLSLHLLPPVFDLVVKGTITNENGEPLSGVSLQIKGTTIGAITNDKGEFNIKAPDANSILVVSFVGYEQQEIPIKKAGIINIVLKPSRIGMEEVVVVGYGTENRDKVLGAVTQVGTEAFHNKSVGTSAQALQGVIPNLNITFGDGQPGRSASFNIRGFNSINGGSPLILIDGVPGDINLIAAEDIEKVTVLKDASSAAIYGARASFGVILITTKSGQSGKINIRYSNNLGISSPLSTPQILMDPLATAEIQNEAWKNYIGSDNATLLKVIDQIKSWQADPSIPDLALGNGEYISGSPTDWYGMLFKKQQTFSDHYLSISGAGANGLKFYLSGGIHDQDGAYKVATDNYKRYNFRSKLNYDVNKWLSFYDYANFEDNIYNSPNKFVTGGYNIYRFLSQFASPYEVVKAADGEYSIGGMLAFGQLEKGGRSNAERKNLNNTAGFQIDLVKNRLRINGDYSTLWSLYRADQQYKSLYYSQKPGRIVKYSNPNSYASSYSEGFLTTINLYATFDQSFGDHHVKVIGGFNQQEDKYHQFIASRTNNMIDGLASLNLTDGVADVGDDQYQWATRGYFYRVGYDYQRKYLIEFNGRYDGTSRFPSDHRFGFFPSAAVGWMVSKEKFFKPILPYVGSLKIRSSYGSLGNQQVGVYSYINSLGIKQSSVILDGIQPDVTSAPALVAGNLTWERVGTVNLGTDVSLLKDRLTGSFDWYERRTKDMLVAGQALPAVLGTGAPKTNSADVLVKGWEVSLKWQDQLTVLNKPFEYHMRFVISNNKGVITRYDNNPNNVLSDYIPGQELGTIWGYKTLGFFQTDDEYLTSPDQSRVGEIVYLGSGHPLAGDLKFADISNDGQGDGKIDNGKNTLEDHGDLMKIGNSNIQYPYSFDFGFSWKNFDVSVFLQGIGKHDFWPGNESAYFWGPYNRWNNPVYKHIYNNYWTPENTDAYFPRLRAYTALKGSRELTVAQTRYLQNAAYLRLKSLIVGYSFPKKWLNQLDINNARFFVSAQNLFTWTKLNSAFDPEAINDDPDTGTTNGRGFVYPIQKTLTAGIEISF
jgi:TonB-linked SusC/RagA family outer membrane protein